MITSSLSSLPAQQTLAPTNKVMAGAALGEDAKALVKSLRNDDLGGARQAYANIVKNAPEGATWPKGSAFADVGRALLLGDIPAARESFGEMLRNVADAVRPPPVSTDPTPMPAPAQSTTGGLAGSTLNEVA